MQWLFATTLFLSAALLFAVQPMFAKMATPRLGGAPAVWNTCMVFYQAMLLGGYLYAHVSTRWLGVRRQAAWHLAVLALPWFVLPIQMSGAWEPSTGVPPVLWLLARLSLSIGLPFFVVSASAPMLQAWFSHTGQASAKDPYWLYAASNLGSMIALLAYPLLVEPALSLTWQSRMWTAGYAVLTVLIAGCAVALWRGRARVPNAGTPRTATAVRTASQARRHRPGKGSPHQTAGAVEPPLEALTGMVRLRCLALALVPSSLLLGVTAHISADILAVPLLWVVPLALYLLTFVLAFAQRPWVPHARLVRWQPVLILLVAIIFEQATRLLPPTVWLLIHWGTFFVIALVCHGELARLRPGPEKLTEFYLWIAVGGVLGGMFNALVAPVVFTYVVEYPLMIAAACLLCRSLDASGENRKKRAFDLIVPMGLAMLAGGLLLSLELAKFYVSSGFTMLVLVLVAVALFFCRQRPLRFGLGVGVMLWIGGCHFAQPGFAIHAERNFFGLLRVHHHVFHDRERQLPLIAHVFSHGSTQHGVQFVDAPFCDEPLSYYSRKGPLGQLFRALGATGRLKEIGVTGLGAGAVAAYGQPGQRFTMYEIDPAVERMARNPKLFTYLSRAQAQVEVVMGDARLQLEKARPGQFDLLILDAYTSDSLPAHLVSIEAMRLYAEKLARRGVIAVNISSRFFRLDPLFARMARSLNMVCYINDDSNLAVPRAAGESLSAWLAIARRPEDLGRLLDNPQWEAVPVDPQISMWTDDFSNVLSVFRWWP